MSSPERPKSVKVQYSSKHRRKKSAANDQEYVPDEDGSEYESSVGTSPKAPANKMDKTRTGPKKIEVHLPGPTPTRSKSTRNDLLQHSPPNSGKLLPSLKTTKPSTERFRAPELETDDASSIAESSKGPRIRRAEPERLQILQTHANCSDLEPHRALCSQCGKWVNLGKKQTYALRPWFNHVDKCTKRGPSNQEQEDDSDEDDNVSSAAPSISSERSTTRRTEPERQAVLEADPLAEEVQPHQALCKTCHKWIKLGSKRPFDLSNWNKHQQSCSKAVPSSRVATAQRKMKLVNDSQAKTFTARSVECMSCGEWVALDGENREYDLTNWEEHKEQCPSMGTSTITTNRPLTDGNVGNLKSYQIRPPTSVGSDATLIASEATSSPGKGGKRPREPEEEEHRPSNRQRTDDYEPPEQEAPGPFGWFLLPFKTFIRGFREGMRPPSSSK